MFLDFVDHVVVVVVGIRPRAIPLTMITIRKSIGPLHDLVTWYKIKYTGEQVTQWDLFVLEVPLCNLLTSIYSLRHRKCGGRGFIHCVFTLSLIDYTSTCEIAVRNSDWLYRLFSHVKIKRIDLYK